MCPLSSRQPKKQKYSVAFHSALLRSRAEFFTPREQRNEIPSASWNEAVFGNVGCCKK